ncbi:hypothetical protein PUN28_004552 [Cardiocondyla obscurior]|uniref:Uncharacterized protein n=1 Tax=Cardiocondyla obscurior TaxID=286306 RepID=A0AAW2GE44_9HYME
MPALCTRDRIDFRESGRADSPPGSCITRGRQVARFRPAETIVPTGTRLQKQSPPIVSVRIHGHPRNDNVLDSSPLANM